MALRLHEWNRRVLGLSTCLLLCACVGCSTSKEDRKPLTNEVGSTLSPPTPLIPVTNGSPGTTVARNPDPATGQFNTGPPVMPLLPSGPNRAVIGPSISTPNNNMNQASFGSTSVPNNQAAPVSNNGAQPLVPLQQPLGGQQLQVPQMQVPQIPQPIASQQHPAPEPQAPQYQSQMPGVQLPPVEQSPPAQTAPPQNRQALSTPAVQQPAVPTSSPPPAPIQQTNPYLGSTQVQPTNLSAPPQAVPTYNPPPMPTQPTVPTYNQAPTMNQFQGSTQLQQTSPPLAAPTVPVNPLPAAPQPQQMNVPSVAPPTKPSTSTQAAGAPLPPPPSYVPPPPVQPVQPVQPIMPIQMQQPPSYPPLPAPAPQGPNLSNNAAAELSEIASKLDTGNSSTAPAAKVVSGGRVRSVQLDAANPLGEPVEGASIYTEAPR
jgi:hypothetical protein